MNRRRRFTVSSFYCVRGKSIHARITARSIRHWRGITNATFTWNIERHLMRPLHKSPPPRLSAGSSTAPVYLFIIPFHLLWEKESSFVWRSVNSSVMKLFTDSLLIRDVQLRLDVRLQLVFFKAGVDPPILHDLLQKVKPLEADWWLYVSESHVYI